MSSEEIEVDLPVAAKVTAVGGMPDDGAAIQNFGQITEGDELVKKSDAEEAIKKARQQERQKVLDKIEEEIKKRNQTQPPISDREIYEKSLLEELRSDLKEEVEEA